MAADHEMQIVAVKNVEPQYVEMRVPLYSYGCERKIKNTLAHLKGIYSVSVEYRQQKVTVWGICNKHDVLAMVRSKRKAARFWDDDVVLVQEEEEEEEEAIHQLTDDDEKAAVLVQVQHNNKSRKNNNNNNKKKSMMMMIKCQKPPAAAAAASLAIITLFRTQSLSFKLSLKKAFNRSFSF